MSAILSLSGVSKRFPGVLALSDVSFDAVSGEVHAVMGENGAGKSTLMKVIAGIHAPDAGVLSLEGRERTFKRPQDANDAGIRTVFQELTVLPNRSVAENVLVGREPLLLGGFAVDAKGMVKQAQSVLDTLGISIDARVTAGTLSAGQRQMVEIARACLTTPKVLILDEPTSSLGREEELLLFDLVAKLKAKGVAIVYITHRMSEVFQLSDRITVLRDGRLVATGPAAGFTRQSLIKAMVGRDVSEERHGLPKGQLKVALQIEALERLPYVRDASLTLHAGEVLGVAGLMGSGRTELARLAGGADQPDAGAMTLFGEPFRPAGVRDAINNGVVYVPEDRKHLGLLLSRSVGENLALPSLPAYAGSLGLLKRAPLRKMIRSWMEKLGVKAASPDVSINTLSGGNQQKVVLAKWLATAPRVILFDEPTRGVDVGAKAEIYAKIRALAADGAAILVISSELPEVITISDRIAVMAHGCVVGVVDAASATEESLLELAFTEIGDAA